MHAGGQEFDPPRLHQVPSSGFRWRLGKGGSKHKTGFLKSQRPSAARAALGRWLHLASQRSFHNSFDEAKHLSLAWGRCNPKKSNTTRTTSASCAAVLTHCRACGERTPIARSRATWNRPPQGNRRRSTAMWPRLSRAGLYGQANKRIRWMPWQLKAMKDVAACDKPRGVGNRLRSGDFRMGKPSQFSLAIVH